MAEGLKACPWCERTDYLLCSETSTDESYAKHQILARIVCTNPIHNGCIDGPAVVTAQPFVDPMKPAPEAIIAWNTRLPPPWRPDREAVARLIYEADPFFEAGEFVDGFPVSPGGYLTWEQAQARDAEFSGDTLFKPILANAYGLADAILALQPPTEDRGDA